jgi:hypothetical protein
MAWATFAILMLVEGEVWHGVANCENPKMKEMVTQDNVKDKITECYNLRVSLKGQTLGCIAR